MKRISFLFIFFVISFIPLPLSSLANEQPLIGQLQSENVSLYLAADSSSPVATMNALGTVFQYQPTENPEWISLSIGSNTYFMQSQFMKTVEMQMPNLTNDVERQIQTKSAFKVYSEPNSTSKVLIQGNSATDIKTIGYENGFFKVSIGGNLGYFPGNYAVIKFEKPAMSIQVIDTKVPLYENRSGKRVQIGSVASGYIFNRMKEVSGYHQFAVKGKTYEIPINGTFPSTTKAILKPSAKPVFPATVRVEKETPVSNSFGVQMGSLSRGTMLTMLNFSKDKAVFEFLGSVAYIPLKDVTHSNLVQPKKNISHREMSYWTQVIAGMYPEFIKLEMIGKSVEGRAIYALKIGTGKKEILFDAAFHAREHMTTNVLLEMMDNYSIRYNNNSSYAGYNVKQVLDQTSIWFVPMMNPDGVSLVQGGKNAVKNGSLAQKINGSTNFARWKANVRGVDLNKNFDAGWKYISNNIRKPHYMGYRGPRPFSEPEAVALKQFIERHKFMSYITYHSSGQVLYWFNFQSGARLSRDIQYVNQLRSITGYSVVPPYYLKGTGASQDWFVATQKMPGVTVEIAPYAGEKPVPLAYWDRIWKQNHKVGLHAANEAWKRK